MIASVLAYVVCWGVNMAKPPFLFTEEKHQVYYHDIKVFICGADVTPWITSQITVSFADRNGLNTCSFSLANSYRSFEITNDNLNKKFRMGNPYSSDGHYSELAKYSIYTWKTNGDRNHKFQIGTYGPVKSATIGGKLLSPPTKVVNTDAATVRFPMNVGSLVFHKYDPVRVFIKNPLNRKDEWVSIFNGYLDTKPYQQDYTTGIGIINIGAQDIRLLMQGMRVGLNPASHIGNENTVIFGKPGQAAGKPVKETIGAGGFFNDLIAQPSTISHVLGGMTFKESINFLIFGNKKGGKTTGEVSSLTAGTTKKYTPGDKEALEDWNNLVVFGEKRAFLNTAEMLTLGASTTPGGVGSADLAKVHFLFPADGAPQTNLVSAGSVDSRYDAKIEWASRLELLQQVCKGIDYQFYVSGNGDLIFEFPMYDFLPVHFNAVWSDLYTFQKQFINDNINDEGGQPISALEITSEHLRQEYAEQNPEGNSQQLTSVATSVELKRTIFSNVLASRLGVHVETYHVPGVTDQNRLAQLGLIEFNKRLADFDKMDTKVVYRPFMGVNRPIYHQMKERMAISTNISYTWQIREEASLDISTSYTRKLENGTFRFIFGGEAVPISYNKVYDNVHAEFAGVGSSGGNKGKAQSNNAAAASSNSSSGGTK